MFVLISIVNLTCAFCIVHVLIVHLYFSRSGFFGTRGKKYPYEFRGRFVGVRGKKTSNEVYGPDYISETDIRRLAEELDFNQLMLLLTATDSNEFYTSDAQSN